MELKNHDHIFECHPQVFGNEKKTVSVGLKCVPKPDFDLQAILETPLGLEARRKSDREFIGKYFCWIKGLKVDGVEITTLDEIYHKVPGDLYNWIYAAVMSIEILTKAQIKN